MIRIIPANSEEVSLEDCNQLHELVRIAYAHTEIEIWGENYIRINHSDYMALIEKGEVLNG